MRRSGAFASLRRAPSRGRTREVPCHFSSADRAGRTIRRSRYARAYPTGRPRSIAGAGDVRHADRPVRSAPHGLACLQRGCGMGARSDAGVRTRKRAAGTVAVRPRMGARAACRRNGCAALHAPHRLRGSMVRPNKGRCSRHSGFHRRKVRGRGAGDARRAGRRDRARSARSAIPARRSPAAHHGRWSRPHRRAAQSGDAREPQ